MTDLDTITAFLDRVKATADAATEGLPIPPRQSTSRDWPEDYPLENGNYNCTCSVCNKPFMGHKRRLVCRSCQKERLETIVSDLNNTSPDCMAAVDELKIMELHSEVESLKYKLALKDHQCASRTTIPQLEQALRAAVEALQRTIDADDKAVAELKKLGICEVDSTLIQANKESLHTIATICHEHP